MVEQIDRRRSEHCFLLQLSPHLVGRPRLTFRSHRPRLVTNRAVLHVHRQVIEDRNQILLVVRNRLVDDLQPRREHRVRSVVRQRKIFQGTRSRVSGLHDQSRTQQRPVDHAAAQPVQKLDVRINLIAEPADAVIRSVSDTVAKRDEAVGRRGEAVRAFEEEVLLLGVLV